MSITSPVPKIHPAATALRPAFANLFPPRSPLPPDCHSATCADTPHPVTRISHTRPLADKPGVLLLSLPLPTAVPSSVPTRSTPSPASPTLAPSRTNRAYCYSPSRPPFRRLCRHAARRHSSAPSGARPRYKYNIWKCRSQVFELKNLTSHQHTTYKTLIFNQNNVYKNLSCKHTKSSIINPNPSLSSAFPFPKTKKMSPDIHRPGTRSAQFRGPSLQLRQLETHPFGRFGLRVLGRGTEASVVAAGTTIDNRSVQQQPRHELPLPVEHVSREQSSETVPRYLRYVTLS